MKGNIHKKLLGMALAGCLTFPAGAQDYETHLRFMEKYSPCWHAGYFVKAADYETTHRLEVVPQIGKPMPAYKLNKELTDKALAGKFVVMDFWATWCSGCRYLTRDIDSLLVRGTSDFADVQFIGVDYKETLADKGYKAEAYWKEKGYPFPTVMGKGVEALGDAVQAGHPTVMVVDDQNILRGRWDAWSPPVADMVGLTLWALKLVPEQGITFDMAAAKQYMERKEWWRAIYILETLPESTEVKCLKLQALAYCNANKAVKMLTQWLEELPSGEEGRKTGVALCTAVAETEPLCSRLTKVAMETMERYNREIRPEDLKLRALYKLLVCHYGRALLAEFPQEMGWLLQDTEVRKSDAETVDYIRRIQEKGNNLIKPYKQ